MIPRRKRVLFFAEAATLAHVVRSIVLARALIPDGIEIAVATGVDFIHLVTAADLPVKHLDCIGTRAYLAAVAAGQPVFHFDTLKRYVEQDLELMQAFHPDLVVGDFRLSLAVSARFAKVPYIAISNAYWSPLADAKFEIPVLPITRRLGVGFSNAVFTALQPVFLAYHCLPMYRLTRHYHASSLGFDLRRLFTAADLTLFADVPEMVPLSRTDPPNPHRYIGPVTWSAPVELPSRLLTSGDRRPIVYVSMGSSGDGSLLDTTVREVVGAGCRAVVAAAPEAIHGGYPEDSVICAPMLPGREMSAIARFVICNGGSPGVHQALEQGTPVLGIPSNLDQLLNMHFVVETGVGLRLRADQLSAGRLAAMIRRLLRDDQLHENAATMRRHFANYRCDQRFREIVSEFLDPQVDRQM